LHYFFQFLDAQSTSESVSLTETPGVQASFKEVQGSLVVTATVTSNDQKAADSTVEESTLILMVPTTALTTAGPTTSTSTTTTTIPPVSLERLQLRAHLVMVFVISLHTARLSFRLL
jgi:hypothetical protein